MERLQWVIQNGTEYFISWYEFDLSIFRIDEIRHRPHYFFGTLYLWQMREWMARQTVTGLERE
jgi:hypothetical protein